MYPKWIYEGLPLFYAAAGVACLKVLSWPYALLPVGAFVGAAGLVLIQRWYYRRQLDGP